MRWFIIGLVFGSLFIMITHELIGSYRREPDCTRQLKGADAEIKHQLFINDMLNGIVSEQNKYIIKIENELGKFYGKSCVKGRCKAQ